MLWHLCSEFPLRAWTQKPKSTSTVLCFTWLLCFTSTAVCFVCFTSSEHQKKLANDMHSQKTVLHINCRLSCLRLTSTAVFHKTAVLHINCRLSVCLNLVEIKHMPKTQIKLFHAGLKITCKTCKHSQTYSYKSRKHLQHTCPPLKLCAVRRQDMPKKNFCFVCFAWIPMEVHALALCLKSHAARRAALTAAKIPLASSLV